MSTPGRVPLLLLFPAYAYALAIGLWGAPPASPVALLGLASTVAPLAAYLARRMELVSWVFPAGAALAGGIALLVFGVGSLEAGPVLLGGLLLGLPLLVVAALLSFSRRPSAFLPTALVGLIGMVSTHAALERSGALYAAGTTPGALALAVGQVVGDQASGLTALFEGIRSVPLPLQEASDPYSVGLLAIALVGLFLYVLKPEPAVAGPDGASLTDPAALGPVGVGILALVGFELLATLAPEAALLGLAGGVLVVLLLLFVYAWVPGRARRERPVSPSEAPVRPG